MSHHLEASSHMTFFSWLVRIALKIAGLRPHMWRREKENLLTNVDFYFRFVWLAFDLGWMNSWIVWEAELTIDLIEIFCSFRPALTLDSGLGFPEVNALTLTKFCGRFVGCFDLFWLKKGGLIFWQVDRIFCCWLWSVDCWLVRAAATVVDFD